jgi:3-oxoacyl-[acyl-carrier-protein] synthase II
MSTDRHRVVVTGSGIVGALAESPAGTYHHMLEGDTGFSLAEPFSKRDDPPRDAVEEFLDPLWSAEVRNFDPARDLGEENFRPLDRLGRLAAVGCARALVDAGWSRQDSVRRGLVLGTMYGGVRTIAEFDRRGMAAGPLYVKPFEFANSVINAAAGQAAIWHHLEGPNATVCAGHASGVQALGLASDLLRAGRVDQVLAGGAEEFCFEIHRAFAAAGRLTPRDHLAIDRTGDHPEIEEGMILGEGAGILALETEASANARGATPLGELLGFGEAFDPSGGTDPQQGIDALLRAVNGALGDAAIEADQIDLIAGASNGCRDLGQRERAAWLERFGATVPPVLYVKEFLGECLGASGGHQLLLSLEALTSNRLPAPGGASAAIGLPSDPSNRIALIDGISPDGHHAALVVRGYR